jgi:hypothetical protein
VYEPTQAGRAAHATWLRTPVKVSTVARDLGLHLMRFVMMEHASSREEVLSFLCRHSQLSRHALGRLAERAHRRSDPLQAGPVDGDPVLKRQQRVLPQRPLPRGGELLHPPDESV